MKTTIEIAAHSAAVRCLDNPLIDPAGEVHERGERYGRRRLAR